MRHRVDGRHFGRDTAHRTSMYRNLVTDLLRYERLTTTEAKAKEIRPMAEKVITLGRRGDLHARRQAARVLFDTKIVKKVFDDIGPRMKDRPGGYLRITGLEPRKGDGARMAQIELVDVVDTPPTPRPRRVTASPAVATPAAPVAAAPQVEPEAPPAAEAAETEAPAAIDESTAEAQAEEVAEAEAEQREEDPSAGTA